LHKTFIKLFGKIKQYLDINKLKLLIKFDIQKTKQLNIQQLNNNNNNDNNNEKNNKPVTIDCGVDEQLHLNNRIPKDIMFLIHDKFKKDIPVNILKQFDNNNNNNNNNQSINIKNEDI